MKDIPEEDTLKSNHFLFIQVMEDTENYKEKSHNRESHHPEANFGKFSFCKNSYHSKKLSLIFL